MAKEMKIDINKIVAQARESFAKNEKGLAAQISSGTGITRPNKDSDFIMIPDPFWNMLTGIRGIPWGRCVQVSGPNNSGKSSFALLAMKHAQDQGHVVIYLDSENKFSPTRFEKFFGGNASDLLVIASKVLLESGDMILALTRSVLTNYPDKKVFIVWDSIGGSLSTAENVKALRESHQMMQTAKENGQVLHAIINLMEEFKDKQTNEERVALLMINQVYANVGFMKSGQIEGGGNKVAYYSSLIIQLTRTADLIRTKDKVKRLYGITTRAKVKKNHLLDSEDTVAELQLDVTAGGITLNTPKKAKAGEEEWAADDEEEGDDV